jgi:hypothetical protein
MVNTARRFTKLTLLLSLGWAGLAIMPFGAQVLAQSAAAFATTPYTQGTTSTVGAATLPPPAPTAVYNGPRPVVMFSATPRPVERDSQPKIEFVEPPPETAPMLAPTLGPAVAQTEAPGPSRPYSITNQAQRDAASTGWDPTYVDEVAAPPMVPGGNAEGVDTVRYLAGQATPQRTNRSPIRRIVQDTGRGLVRDLPEAVADALPWVDRDAKNEPFGDVLDRVADDLHRAALGDPAWALPAQREIRALSKRLDRLAEPPPLPQAAGDGQADAMLGGSDDRPFRPRPIWPGASGRPEAQVRPVTLTTTSGQQGGPTAAGVAARYVPAAEDDDGNPPVPAIAPRQRRPAKSR